MSAERMISNEELASRIDSGNQAIREILAIKNDHVSGQIKTLSDRFTAHCTETAAAFADCNARIGKLATKDELQQQDADVKREMSEIKGMQTWTIRGFVGAAAYACWDLLTKHKPS